MLRPGQNGYKFSEESKRKMSLAKKGKHYPKVAEAKRGHKMPLVTRTAIIKANTGHHRGGWKFSEESRKKMGKHFKGASNPNWKGGITYDKKYLSWIRNKRNRDKRANGGSHTYGEWEMLKAQYNWKCLYCEKQEPDIALTQDHIIPVSKGGSDNIENIQPLCMPCNLRKGTKIINLTSERN